MDFTLEECKEWLEDKETNPRTKRTISENGTVYKKLYKKCIEYKLIEDDNIKNYSISEMKRLSELWYKNKNINPINDKKINQSSKIYKKLKSWYVMLHICNNNININIKNIAKEIYMSEIENVDDYLIEHHSDMLKYKNNIIREMKLLET